MSKVRDYHCLAIQIEPKNRNPLMAYGQQQQNHDQPIISMHVCDLYTITTTCTLFSYIRHPNGTDVFLQIMQYVQCLMAWSTSITLAKRLQTATKEAATGRWCYIISVLGLRHDARRNGFTSRNLTTGDVLTGLA